MSTTALVITVCEFLRNSQFVPAAADAATVLRSSSCWSSSRSLASWSHCCCRPSRLRARAARHAQCQNHLKNLALACINYESTKKQLPPGFVSAGATSTTSPAAIPAWAWSTFILPYIEEQGIYDRLRPSETYFDPVDANRPGRRNLADLLQAAKNGNTAELVPLQTPLPVFRCPSDRTPALIPVGNPPDGLFTFCDGGEPPSWSRHFDSDYYTGLQPSTSNYVGSKGMIDGDCTGLSLNPWVPNQERCNNTGVFFGNSKVAGKSVTDGTSNTFLIGERDGYLWRPHGSASATLVAPIAGARIGPWRIRDELNALVPALMPTWTRKPCAPKASVVGHPWRRFFAFCDASVRFISDDINRNNTGNSRNCYAPPIPASSSNKGNECAYQTIANGPIGIYERLSSRNDGLTIGGGDY